MISVRKVKPEFGIKVGEIPIPEILDNEVLINVKAAGICGSDKKSYQILRCRKGAR